LFMIVVYDRNGKWSSPRGGLSEQPLTLASSAKAFHVLLVFSRMSTIVGWLRLGWLPSPLTPKVLPPRIAMQFGWEGFVMLDQPWDNDNRSASYVMSAAGPE